MLIERSNLFQLLLHVYGMVLGFHKAKDTKVHFTPRSELTQRETIFIVPKFTISGRGVTLSEAFHTYLIFKSNY